MIDFLPDAISEVSGAVDWYRGNSADIAQAFLGELRVALDRAAHDPESWPTLESGYRSVPFRRFPFLLVIRVRPEESLLVVAVAHTSRRRGYWRNRK